MENILASAAGGSNPLEFLTQFGIEWRLLVSQGLSFAIVAIALYFLVFRPVIKTSDERRQKIEQGLNDAEKARQDLAKAEESAKAKLDAAAADAAKVLAEARDSAKRTIENAASEALAKAADIRQSNDEQLLRDKERMKEELRDELGALVVKASENVIGKILTDAQRSQLADLAVKELKENK